MSLKQRVLIISPASAKANNGNGQTALRWQSMLNDRFEVLLQSHWQGEPESDLMIALHARHSAAAIDAWARLAGKPLVLVLTGTDLYRDIHIDTAAQRSLQLAHRLVVLQEAGLAELPPPLRAKACVIYQSAPALARTPPAGQPEFTVVMIGHLRPEKMPQVFMQAAAALGGENIRMLHAGAALDAGLAQQARATQAACPHYQWLGELDHQQARELLASADLTVNASQMEGGANVVIEAVTSDVPVLASDISGNRGMLGRDYAGYFPAGDSQALAAAIRRARREPAFLEQLRRQCRERAPLFAPSRERAALFELVDNVLASQQDPT